MVAMGEPDPCREPHPHKLRQLFVPLMSTHISCLLSLFNHICSHKSMFDDIYFLSHWYVYLLFVIDILTW